MLRKDKVLNYYKLYREKNAEKLKEYNKLYRFLNYEKCRNFQINRAPRKKPRPSRKKIKKINIDASLIDNTDEFIKWLETDSTVEYNATKVAK